MNFNYTVYHETNKELNKNMDDFILSLINQNDIIIKNIDENLFLRASDFQYKEEVYTYKRSVYYKIENMIKIDGHILERLQYLENWNNKFITSYNIELDEKYSICNHCGAIITNGYIKDDYKICENCLFLHDTEEETYILNIWYLIDNLDDDSWNDNQINDMNNNFYNRFQSVDLNNTLFSEEELKDIYYNTLQLLNDEYSIYNHTIETTEEEVYTMVESSNHYHLIEIFNEVMESWNIDINELTYSDEWILCDECNKYAYTQDYHKTSYYIFDGYALCDECIRNNPHDYIKHELDQDYILKYDSFDIDFNEHEYIELPFNFHFGYNDNNKDENKIIQNYTDDYFWISNDSLTHDLYIHTLNLNIEDLISIMLDLIEYEIIENIDSFTPEYLNTFFENIESHQYSSDDLNTLKTFMKSLNVEYFIRLQSKLVDKLVDQDYIFNYFENLKESLV